MKLKINTKLYYIIIIPNQKLNYYCSIKKRKKRYLYLLFIDQNQWLDIFCHFELVLGSLVIKLMMKKFIFNFSPFLSYFNIIRRVEIFRLSWISSEFLFKYPHIIFFSYPYLSIIKNVICYLLLHVMYDWM